MARGVNKVILIGNLGADPESRYTASGTAICTFNLATTDAWTDKQSGEKQERTEWHRVKVFGRLGEIAQEYLKKGKQVYIEGSIRTDKYTDKNGIERYATDVIARDMQFLGGPGEGGGGNYRERQQSPQSSSAGDQRQAPPVQSQPQQGPSGGGFEDDEIPF